ncbi:MAG: RNA methyltransferase [Deltaproteobacteria bacterium]|nr:RNA methyltransferase [Deltaproteobacteria bacterium]
MSQPIDLSVILLHDGMVDKQKKLVVASLTLIDVHDIARSSATYGASAFYVAHPGPTIRKLARTLKSHWEEGFGASYNPNRKEAIEHVRIVSSLDEAITDIDTRTGKLPKLIATSAQDGGKRLTFPACREVLATGDPFVLMLGTAWGMAPDLLARADYFLEPVKGPGTYNHLSVRSACAIMLDRLVGR